MRRTWLSREDIQRIAGNQNAVQGMEVATPQAVQALRDEVARMALLNQALWEVLQDRLGLTIKDIEEKVNEIDLRDGVQDGKTTHVAVRCPTCGRMNSSTNDKCFYCGQLFERPLFG